MYNTDIICTYHTMDIFTEADKISNDEKNFIRNVIYRQELLNILDLEDYSELAINNILHEIYENIKKYKDFNDCLISISSNFLNKNEEFGLVILFAFEYLHLTHLCIRDFFLTGNISKTNIDNLKTEIENNSSYFIV